MMNRRQLIKTTGLATGALLVPSIDEANVIVDNTNQIYAYIKIISNSGIQKNDHYFQTIDYYSFINPGKNNKIVGYGLCYLDSKCRIVPITSSYTNLKNASPGNKLLVSKINKYGEHHYIHDLNDKEYWCGYKNKEFKEIDFYESKVWKEYQTFIKGSKDWNDLPRNYEVNI